MKMKVKTLILCMLIIFSFLIIHSNISYSVEITLEEIADKVRNSSFITSYKEEYNIVYEVKAEKNKIIIKGPENFKFTANLKGNILKMEMDRKGEVAFLQMIFSDLIVSKIGELHGYEEGELATTLSLEEIQNYTLEKEGYQITKKSSKIIIETDITKKIPLYDMSDIYITVDYLKENENLLEFLTGNGSFQMSRADIMVTKHGYDNEAEVYVFEDDQFTERSYKSILSILEVMFDSSKAPKYFKENYSDLTQGDVEFGGMKVEINPTKDSMEEGFYGDKPMIKLTIDKSLFKEEMNSATYSEESSSVDVNNEEENGIDMSSQSKIIHLIPVVITLILCVFR